MMEEYIAAEGPFDGVIGFSQGASLAALHIIRATQGRTECPFRCAIFFSCSGLYDPTALVEKGEAEKLEPDLQRPLIRIPTVHVWGRSDPVKAESVLLGQLCDERLRTIFTHEGGHEVPGRGAGNTVIETVKAMRRGIDTARAAH